MEIDFGWHRQRSGFGARLSWHAGTGVLYVYDCDPKHLEVQPQGCYDEASARSVGARWVAEGYDVFDTNPTARSQP